MKTSLRNMTEECFSNYIETSLVNHAQDNIDTGKWQKDEAIDKARAEFGDNLEKILPQGLKTNNNYLFEIIENNTCESIGHIWLAIEKCSYNNSAFIYHIENHNEYQQPLYAYSAMKNIEEFLIDLDVYNINLHVYNHNKHAKHLYKRLDYKILSHNMSKKLQP